MSYLEKLYEAISEDYELVSDAPYQVSLFYLIQGLYKLERGYHVELPIVNLSGADGAKELEELLARINLSEMASWQD